MNAIELVQSLLVAVLVTSAVGKIRLWRRDEDPWPEGKNFLWLHVPLWGVVLAEAVVIFLYLVPSYVEPALSGLVLGLIYFGFAVAAYTLKGRKCACFGVQGKPIGWLRIMANTAAGLLAFSTVTVSFPAGSIFDRVVQVAVLSSVLLAAFAVHDAVRRKKFEEAIISNDTDLYLIMAPGCAACDALKRLVRDYDLRRAGLRVLDYESEEDREVIQSLSPDIGTPAIVAVRRGAAAGVPEITRGAGSCYAQIKKIADLAHT